MEPLLSTLRERSVTSDLDLSVEEVQEVFSLARRLRDHRRTGEEPPLLRGRVVALIFQKPSTRTRVSFEAGIAQLGGVPMFLPGAELQLTRGEPIADTARVMGRYVDAIVMRAMRQQDVDDLARFSGIPVVNGLSDLYHPCQALADYFTLLERRPDLRGVRLAYIGDGNNVAHSLMLTGARVGAHVVVGAPRGYWPAVEVLAAAQQAGKQTGAVIEVVEDPTEAAAGADALYTDVWTSMGQEAEKQARLRAFAGYQVNAELLRLAKPGAVVMHCLPAHRGEEITDEVIEGPQSVVFDEAENRMHVQKALLALLLAR